MKKYYCKIKITFNNKKIPKPFIKKSPLASKMTKIVKLPKSIITKSSWQIMLNWKGWKWIYWFGIGIGFYILVGTTYNLVIGLTGNYEFLLRKYNLLISIKCITDEKCIITAGLIIITIFVLPCFISLFIKAKYFYKILIILSYTVIAILILLVSILAYFH